MLSASIKRSNEKQERKFCPLTNKLCRWDCSFFVQAHWVDLSETTSFFKDTYCRKH